MRIIIQQSKNRASFEEKPFSKLRSSILDLFDLEKKLPSLLKVYNAAVIAQVGLFRHIYLGMQGKNPAVSFDIVYATKGDKNTANARIRSDGKAILEFLGEEYFKSDRQLKLLGARELTDLANQP